MSEKCAPDDIGLKTFFLGPQAENKDWLLGQIQYLFNEWFSWRENYAPQDGRAISDSDQQEGAFLKQQQTVERTLSLLSKRFNSEVPKFTPRYIAHMFSELSLPALLGHILTLLHNPNNVSGEASRVGIQIEKEAIQDLMRMVGYLPDKGVGHFTSGGTIANFEGLARARTRIDRWLELAAFLTEQNIHVDPRGYSKFNLFTGAHMGWERFETLLSELTDLQREKFDEWRRIHSRHPVLFSQALQRIFHVAYQGPLLLVPGSAHYSWEKGAQLFGFGVANLRELELDSVGRLDLQHLTSTLQELELAEQPVAMVVSIAGTTELGTVDSMDAISKHLGEWKTKGLHFWHHVDAAYGGFLCSMARPAPVPSEKVTFSGLEKNPEVNRLMGALRAIGEAQSVTLDPHKLGYVPYASGVFLTKQKEDYVFQSVQAPYIQFDPTQDVGLQTLEGSRSAAGAVATWLTEKTIGLHAEGYGRILKRTMAVKESLGERLRAEIPECRQAPGLDTNVLTFTFAIKGATLSRSNAKVLALYQLLGPSSKGPFIVSKTSLRMSKYKKFIISWVGEWEAKIDTDRMELIRLCLMNPFFSSAETNFCYEEEFARYVKQFSETCSI